MWEKRWVAFYPEGVNVTLDYPEASLFELFLQTAERYPKREAVHFLGKKMTYAQLKREVFRFANALHGLGVRKGHRVSIMLPNTPQSIIAYYASLALGALVVQTNPLYTESELMHQLDDAQVDTILAIDLVYPRLSRVLRDLPLKNVIYTSLKDYLPFPKNLLYPVKQRKDGMAYEIPYGQGIYALTDLVRQSSDEAPPKVEIVAKEDLALLQYTGGTTGWAKGAMLTHYNLVVNALQCSAWLQESPEEQTRILGALPFFHVYGMTVVMNYSILAAGLMILLPRFDVTEVLKTIQQEKPTLFPGAPTMYIALVNHPDVQKYDLSSIKACISGSSALPSEVQKRFEELTKGRLVEGYGLTEASPVTHANPLFGHSKSGSIGIPWPDTEAKVVNEAGEEVETGEVGELIVRGPQVMKGYWNRSEETAAALQGDWLFTGDMAKVDDEGYFYIVDRKKDMVIASGFNIYPREVEEVLFQHPAVQEAAVIGVPDPYRGETVKAFLVLKEGESVTEEELEMFCRDRLSAYKVPRLFEFRLSLPKTLVGKVLRRALAEEEQTKNRKQE